MTDQQIIDIRKATRADTLAAWSDSIAFARAVIAEARKVDHVECENCGAYYCCHRCEAGGRAEIHFADAERIVQ